MSIPSGSERPDFAPLLEGIRRVPGVTTALVATPDGLLVAGGTGEVDELWAAVAAVLGKLGGRVISSAGGGTLEAAVFGATRFQCVVRSVSIGFVLAVAEPEAAVEPICIRLAATANSLEEVVHKLRVSRMVS